MIKNIIFDMGGVLIDYDPVKILNRFALTSEEKEIILSEVFDSKYWFFTDAGMSYAEAFEYMKESIPKHLHEKALYIASHWYAPDIVFTHMVDFVKSLKESGYNLYLLSNAGLDHDVYWDKTPFAKYFDGTVISAIEKTWKPCLEIYKVLLDRYGLNPEECVFIDDKKENVGAAMFLGIEGIVYKDLEDLRCKLKNLGVEIHD